jgi:multidrug efflux pump subunit AcrA (membrane-fusion protein)
MARNNGTRAAVAAEDAKEQENARALALAAEQAAAAQAQAEADAVAAAAAQAAADADAKAQADADAALALATGERKSMRDLAAAQTAAAAKVAVPLVLAHGCEWHVQPGIGKHGVTVETDASGAKSRYFLTFVPQVGRVHKVPALDSLFALLDAGDLE